MLSNCKKCNEGKIQYTQLSSPQTGFVTGCTRCDFTNYINHPDERIYVFVEPHFTGGESTIEISESKIMKFMAEHYSNVPLMYRLETFITIHWAWEKNPER